MLRHEIEELITEYEKRILRRVAIMEYAKVSPDRYNRLEEECTMYTCIIGDLKGALRNAKED